MARARNIKPGIFKNEILGVADPLCTLLFEGLWMLADREGRLEDRPIRIKGELFPYRDGVDVVALVTWLEQQGFVRRYQADGKSIIQIINPNRWYSDTSAAPAAAAATAGARRARKRQALPKWADRAAIRSLYAEARALTKSTGIPHHVDHEIPLAGRMVCGLHVLANLRILTAGDNLRKSNKFGGANG